MEQKLALVRKVWEALDPIERVGTVDAPHLLRVYDGHFITTPLADFPTTILERMATGQRGVTA